jgi:hypothetical protein
MTTSISNRSRRILVILLVFAFVGGLSVGVIGDRLARRVGQPSTRVTTDISSVLDELSLTKEQRTQANAIMDGSAPRTEAVMFEVAGRLQGISDSVDRELRLILTPPQRSKLDSLRRRPIFLLKRERANGKTSVDTLYPGTSAATLHNR